MQITDRAMEKLEDLRDATAHEEGQGITLVMTEAGELGFAISSPRKSDQVFERNGEPVMIIPESLVEPLETVVLDYVETPEQTGFTLDQQE
ncbi:adhesin [Nitrolancea hollandica]|uniref:HesB/YadR/YfhF-family protein n=1 Tax=Nitrolancea hollandica Lb TaxID=1129897 RepID=I4EDC5_9BACT|nr:adhesin [Nitrolancea hollandica]CCF82687.1 HesB/YadR/YfhF-family protein [Nitrolancea hollandica Lb]